MMPSPWSIGAPCGLATGIATLSMEAEIPKPQYS
jgi:hypothetical protein